MLRSRHRRGGSALMQDVAHNDSTRPCPKELENPFGQDTNDISLTDLHLRFVDYIENGDGMFLFEKKQQYHGGGGVGLGGMTVNFLTHTGPGSIGRGSIGRVCHHAMLFAISWCFDIKVG